ncbi:hypothetical protein Bpfe_025033 [Biomphalaria pfeifferi]|uniref:SUEL-type lectin domain-containing protein n=1 Tax=Biomphalaria pfeifferi TaxID=112525 RepID=A0AAD8B131_BIOPF|nr:hypothetical protein Bpfe_025033 [Biomphalaria pfeifferi]
MRNCLGLSICTLIVLLLFTTVEGGTDFPQKCLENFIKPAETVHVICINGNLTQVEGNNLTCRAGELLYIDDFALYLSIGQNRQCLSLDGFHYNKTITASCLNREYKDTSKDIALVLMSSYNNIAEVQSSLNRIVADMYMLSVEFHCRPGNQH